LKKLNIIYDFLTIDENSMRQIADILVRFYERRIARYEVHDKMRRRQVAELTKDKGRLEFWRDEKERLKIG
jgi:hypothetical protein